jgi:hypothetical protein
MRLRLPYEVGGWRYCTAGLVVVSIWGIWVWRRAAVEGGDSRMRSESEEKGVATVAIDSV